MKTFYYGCGGYIAKGRSICEMNAIPQKVVEETVIKMVLDFYRWLLGKGGRTELAEAVRALIGSEAEEFVAARKPTQYDQQDY
ncbi:zinc ribbon domain-containing protein [Planctomycetota bacterium]